MKNTIKYIGTALLSATLLFNSTSCTKNLEDINVDQKAITSEDLERDYAQIKSYFPGMMNSIMKINPEWMYQIQQNLNADIFSGYMMTPTPFAGNENNATYKMMDGWNNFAISVPVENVLNPWLEVKSLTEDDYKDWYSISLILKVFAGHRIVDIFGPFPYSNFGLSSEFDSEEKAYTTFFEELDYAINTLEKYKGSESEIAFAGVDVSTLNGDYVKWIQLANTLRLRLAIRISNVAPGMAEGQARKALSNPNGLLENDDFLITHTFNHPISTVSRGWGDILMGAPIESILSGYQDPRMEKYFLPAEGNVVAGQFKGIRQGIELTDKAEYGGFSKINIESSAPLQLMTASEAYFLRAEAALRGWGGDAKTFYEDGVRRSFAQHGAADVDAYLQSTNKPAPYVDPLHPENNVGPNDVSAITVAWDDADSDEVKLEKIITQKWIAIFPDGQEAWSEHRRTGYPKLFPVVINHSDIPDGEFISRLPYPADFKATNPTAVQEAVDKFLGGNDKPETKLWWAK
jgi:hypothetical protein